MTHDVKFDESELSSWLDSEIVAGRLRCGALEVMLSDKSAYTKCFGNVRAINVKQEVTRDTKFWIASMTKPIVSAAAMVLIESGQLSLTDLVSKFVLNFGQAGVLDSVRQVVPLERPVTVLNLMTHTSGLTYGSMGDQPIHRQYGQAQVYNFEANNREMANRLSRLPLLQQPGTTFEYGMSTDILGRVIEVVTGQELDKALQQLVLTPLKMTRTSFFPDEDNRAILPSSSVRDTFAAPLSERQKWWSGGAGLWSTLSDYLRFARMLKAGGVLEGYRFLNSDSITQMLQNHLPADIGFGSYTESLGITAPMAENGLGFGLGMAVRTTQVNGIPGGLGEFFWAGISGANFWVDPSNELIVVFLTHAPEHRAEHRLGLRNAIYKGLYRG